MKHYPRVEEQGKALIVEFVPHAAQSERKPLDIVLDFDEFGSVIGIEIISLFFHAGENSLETIRQVIQGDGGALRYSYDKESDSFYLRLKAARSRDQKAVLGSVFLDNNGRMLGLSASWN